MREKLICAFAQVDSKQAAAVAAPLENT